MKIKILISSILISTFCWAQKPLSNLKGHLTGSLESYSQYYMKDEKIQAIVPQDKVAANSFFKIDYTQGNIMLGVQYESYMPSILGYYDVPQNGSKLVNKYFRYSEKNFSIQVGDFYEQFGSGMILRSFENRQIGINNAIEGANIFIQPAEYIKIKTLFGKPRKYLSYANATIRGADVEFDLQQLVGNKNSQVNFTIGGSYVGKFEEYTGPIDDFPSTSTAYATRMAINSDKINFDLEYVHKNADPHLLNAYTLDKGQALQMNFGYTKPSFGLNINARALNNMDFRSERESESATQLTVNYLPALTKQQDYLTSNIYVYNTQNRGEIGFQTDVFYNFKKGSKLGGKYGTKLALNIAYYGALNDNRDLLSIGSEVYYKDFNLEVKKKWNKNFETTLGLQHLFYNTSRIQVAAQADVVANVIAFGGVYKLKNNKSIKYKLERMIVDNDNGNWMAGTIEFSPSSKYNFYINDLYNDGKTNVHYYNVGAAITSKSTRFSINYGKQRPGLFCVGGVCRFVPAAYGFTATLTTSFSN